MKKTLSLSLLVITLAVLPSCTPLESLKEALGMGGACKMHHEEPKEMMKKEPAPMPEPKEEGEAAEEMMNESADEMMEKKSKMSEDILISMNGKPVVTMDDLEQDYKQVLEERPASCPCCGCCPAPWCTRCSAR